MNLYVSLGTNDFAKAVTFYDQLFADIGAERSLEEENFVVWSKSSEHSGISITKPYNGQAATIGNGTMVAIAMDSIEQVNHFYQKALELGATAQGKPSYKSSESSYYAAYFRDLDGHKLSAFYIDKNK